MFAERQPGLVPLKGPASQTVVPSISDSAPLGVMLYYILIPYFVLNLLLGLALHLRTSWRTLERPKPMELAVYSVVMLLIGLPLFILMWITQGTMPGSAPPRLEVVPDQRKRR